MYCFVKVVFNYATITLFGVIPFYIYWLLLYLAVLFGIIMGVGFHFATKLHDEYKKAHGELKRKCSSKTRLATYRQISALPVISVKMQSGHSLIPLTRAVKAKYLCNVLDWTVYFVLA